MTTNTHAARAAEAEANHLAAKKACRKAATAFRKLRAESC